MDPNYDVITAVAVLSLAKTADIDDVRAVYDGEFIKLEAHLEVLKQAPLAFIALLNETDRATFVKHVRDKFVETVSE